VIGLAITGNPENDGHPSPWQEAIGHEIIADTHKNGCANASTSLDERPGPTSSHSLACLQATPSWHASALGSRCSPHEHTKGDKRARISFRKKGNLRRVAGINPEHLSYSTLGSYQIMRDLDLFLNYPADFPANAEENRTP
jgi:hypothetical protein